jgi:hypothetical protein
MGGYVTLSPEILQGDEGGAVSVRIVLAASHAKTGPAELVAALSAEASVARVEAAAYHGGWPLVLVVHGVALAELARAITRAVATTGIAVELVEPVARSREAIFVAVANARRAATEASP